MNQNQSHHQHNQHDHQNNQGSRHGNQMWGGHRGGRGGRGGRGRGSFNGRPQGQQGIVSGRPKNILKFENDYDFEQANTEFDKIRVQLSKVKIADGENPKPEVRNFFVILYMCIILNNFLNIIFRLKLKRKMIQEMKLVLVNQNMKMIMLKQ